MPNHLIHETSPYLQQHAQNPVDWYAWKPEALERAKRENKPILVSVGYSTCHWCHVMEHESFEHEDVAEVMNAYFINIKVDREERPDVDAIYMEACQILTGSGGWPLNCFLTPDGRPFFAGTYYPPLPAHGRPSWGQVLQHIAKVWRNEPEKVEQQAERLMEAIRRNEGLFFQKKETQPEAENPLNQLYTEAETPFLPPTLENIFYRVRERFDRVDGGFGAAPKFPSSMAVSFLLSYAYFAKNQEALDHALFSLQKMCEGGIYDQLGGGFARYATDSAWLIPHFEKMLYDNALLVKSLCEAVRFLRGGLREHLPESQDKAYFNRLFSTTIKETLAFLEREMQHPEGGFYSAYDADSEGVEGKFYVWQKNEIEEVLGEKAELFCTVFDVTEAGNWEHANILWQPKPLEKIALEKGMDLNVLISELDGCRRLLFEKRKERIPPGLDDKILLDWNALMVSAFVEAYKTYGEAHYLEVAKRAVDFIEKHFKKERTRLFHTWKDGKGQYDAYLDDYANYIAALLDLYETDFSERYLRLSEDYTAHVLTSFSSKMGEAFFFTADYQPDLVLRRRDVYDNATPSGNSTMVQNLQRLGLYLDKPDWRKYAVEVLASMQPSIEKYSLSFMRWASALAWEVYPPDEVAVVGENAIEKANDIQAYFWPHKIMSVSNSENDVLPLLRGKTAEDDALIYICKNYACQRPVKKLEELKT